MTDAEPGGERTARRSPQRSPIRGGGATASYSRCRMMLHSDHSRLPTLRPKLCRLTRGARHRFCEDTSSRRGCRDAVRHDVMPGHARGEAGQLS